MSPGPLWERGRPLSPRVRSLRFGALCRIALPLLAVAIGAAACSSGATSAPTTTVPLPAGPTPSSIATMVCTKDALQKFDAALGETATLSKPTWTDHLYSCRYDYPDGTMAVSVKELSSWAETKAYFQSLASEMGRVRDLQNLGQEAFQTDDGSMVVRKDWKVLLVDAAGLPPQFGQPPTSSADVAVTVADVILGCWNGD
jgi:hypothetical protein